MFEAIVFDVLLDCILMSNVPFHINKEVRTNILYFFFSILESGFQESVFTIRQLSCLSSLLDDPTVQGLDKSRHLQTGEMIIIVVVLVMWAGRFIDCMWLIIFIQLWFYLWSLLYLLV